LTAIFAGQVQEANALIHPDGEVSEYTEDAAERNEALDLTIQSLEITEESENTATVDAVVTLENPEADEESTRSQIYHLQTDDGTWKIYSAEEDEAA
jgi:transcription elongation GreA/GreB family factor